MKPKKIQASDLHNDYGFQSRKWIPNFEDYHISKGIVKHSITMSCKYKNKNVFENPNIVTDFLSIVTEKDIIRFIEQYGMLGKCYLNDDNQLESVEWILRHVETMNVCWDLTDIIDIYNDNRCPENADDYYENYCDYDSADSKYHQEYDEYIRIIRRANEKNEEKLKEFLNEFSVSNNQPTPGQISEKICIPVANRGDLLEYSIEPIIEGDEEFYIENYYNYLIKLAIGIRRDLINMNISGIRIELPVMNTDHIEDISFEECEGISVYKYNALIEVIYWLFKEFIYKKKIKICEYCKKPFIQVDARQKYCPSPAGPSLCASRKRYKDFLNRQVDDKKPKDF